MAQRQGIVDKRNLEEKFFSQNLEALNGFKNIYLNNLDKISNSNLKMIGYKNEFVEQQAIMERFLKIVTGVLSCDEEKICVNNQKMLEKVFYWSLYWAISSSLPISNLERLDKIFDTIKISFDRSQAISETKVVISERNSSISKPIKINKYLTSNNNYIKITNEMEAKAEFMKVVSYENCPIFITGDKDGGKSLFLDYFQAFLGDDAYTFLKIRVHKNLTLNEFLKKLEEYTFMKYLDTEEKYSCKVTPLSGKKLVIMLDDFNQIARKSELI